VVCQFLINDILIGQKEVSGSLPTFYFQEDTLGDLVLPDIPIVVDSDSDDLPEIHLLTPRSALSTPESSHTNSNSRTGTATVEDSEFQPVQVTQDLEDHMVVGNEESSDGMSSHSTEPADDQDMTLEGMDHKYSAHPVGVSPVVSKH